MTWTFVFSFCRVLSGSGVLSRGGDSGSPVYNGHKALGILHSGFTSDPNSSFYGDFTFMGINYITDQGLEIMIQPR